MRRKLKDKKICIYRRTFEEGELCHFSKEKYTKIHEGKLWAHYRQTSAKEFFDACAVQYEEEAIFTINWIADISAKTDVILYNHHVYNINRVDDYEGYKRELIIGAKRSPRDSPEAYPGIVDE